MNGQGIMIYADGNQYNGVWVDNAMHGQGSYTWKNSKRKYEGMFEKGLKHGEGVFTWNNGTTITGTWKNGKLDGDSSV